MLAKSLMGSSTRVPSARFKTRYPKLEVDEDPFAKLPSDAEVPAPTDIPFDNHPATPPALPPPPKLLCRTGNVEPCLSVNLYDR
ncbi:hypothetical protein BHE74_00035807 [Ensete ventricosum]|nr:hypothetical protein BHE74_00035807 [Ensete ventricosum]